MMKSETATEARTPLRPEFERCIHPTTITELHRGVMLFDLVRCALLAREKEDSLALRREGPLFVQRMDGREIVMELTPTSAAAVIHDDSSLRSPGRSGRTSLFDEMQRAAPPARRRVLERLGTGMRPPASERPWATTLLWNEGEHLCSPGTWSDFLAHGGWMLEPLTMEPLSALRGYQRAHGLRDTVVELIAALHERRMRSPGEWIVIERGECDLLLSHNARRFAAANEILLALHIHAPYKPS
jgi:hypothetical protein